MSTTVGTIPQQPAMAIASAGPSYLGEPAPPSGEAEALQRHRDRRS